MLGDILAIKQKLSSDVKINLLLGGLEEHYLKGKKAKNYLEALKIGKEQLSRDRDHIVQEIIKDKTPDKVDPQKDFGIDLQNPRYTL